MFVEPKIETYRFIGEVASLNGQSMVECRLPGSEISSILAVEAKPCLPKAFARTVK